MPIVLHDTQPPRVDWQRHRLSPAAPPAVRQAPASGRSQAPTLDSAFVGLQTAYRASGGIADGEALVAILVRARRDRYVDLARRIAAGHLFSFRWRRSFWLPMFQLEPHQLTLREAPQRVLDELRGAMTGWRIAHWYVGANAALDGACPLDRLEPDLPAVLAAARADRHIVDG